MANFKVIQQYNDLEFKRLLKKNEEVEMTVKRADAVEKTLSEKGYEGPFLERIDNKDKK
ncbi:hypothetical protein [Staphylococcus haemolyticus]|uniref:hypothetical protein n=1 Tax=Staphylococcus haemolyticus TaxID=1283 RepID=UPI0015D7ED7C|nr:hypothetical protein [Staphylococcus haemolyticus]MCH4426178.1 hypothetical protein [Staphylococcus haemolyticus]MCH4440234.1 hypothetical protein [Staphylococcus haemolyticus]MEB3516859.1 hypothetical protein [Staphylococcus haemolyticus]